MSRRLPPRRLIVIAFTVKLRERIEYVLHGRPWPGCRADPDVDQLAAIPAPTLDQAKRRSAHGDTSLSNW
jgi:hypothetical protein